MKLITELDNNFKIKQCDNGFYWLFQGDSEDKEAAILHHSNLYYVQRHAQDHVDAAVTA